MLRHHTKSLVVADYFLKLTWVPDVKDDSDEEHQNTVEDIQRPFVRQWISVISHQVFDNAEDGSNHNKGADCVKHAQALLPRVLGVE